MLTTRRDNAREFGRDSESVAERHLRRQGYRIVGRNIHWPDGELDLVATFGSTLVFVEVKARRSMAMGGAAFAVSADKRSRLIRLGAKYLAQHQLKDQACRFDVILVQQHSPHGQAVVEHVENAFEVTGDDLRW